MNIITLRGRATKRKTSGLHPTLTRTTLFGLLVPSALLITSAVAHESGTTIEARMTPVTFGVEQKMVYGIASWVVFAKALDVDVKDIERAHTGRIDLRNKAVAVMRGRRAGKTVYAVDTNRDGKFADETFAVANGKFATHTVDFGKEVVTVDLKVDSLVRTPFARAVARYA